MTQKPLCWFSPADYLTFRAELLDGANLPATYLGWLQFCKDEEAHLSAQGYEPLRIPVFADEARDLCLRLAVPFNFEACLTLARLKARNLFGLHLKNPKD